jgi:hypothetical protein
MFKFRFESIYLFLIRFWLIFLQLSRFMQKKIIWLYTDFDFISARLQNITNGE